MRTTPSVRDVVDYLGAHGWAVTARWRGGSVWTRNAFDVLVPPDDEASDAPARIRDLLECVADAEDRTPREISRDMITPAVDLVSYRMSGTEADRIALASGARAMSAIGDLITTCAGQSAADLGAGPSAAGALLEHSVLSPAAEAFGADVALPIEEGLTESLGRRTSRRVLSGSTTALDAALGQDPAALDDLSASGVTGELCQALAELAGHDHTAAFTLGFRWSRLVPADDGPVSVRFPPGVGERLAEGARRLGRRVPGPVSETAVVEGPVTTLSDEEHGNRWRVTVRGTMIINGVPEGAERLARLRLDGPSAYSAALIAHRENRVVRAEGVLTRSGNKRWIMVNPGGFTLPDPGRAGQ